MKLKELLALMPKDEYVLIKLQSGRIIKITPRTIEDMERLPESDVAEIRMLDERIFIKVR